MEPEWKQYLRENAPELYKQMIADVAWDAKWRDDKIAGLEAELTRYRAGIERSEAGETSDG